MTPLRAHAPYGRGRTVRLAPGRTRVVCEHVVAFVLLEACVGRRRDDTSACTFLACTSLA